MTIITESLISECQSQKTICLNDTLRNSYTKTIQYTTDIGITFNISNPDIKKILIHNLIIDICELKKSTDRGYCFYIDASEFNDDYNNVISDVFNKMELYKFEKSKNFYKTFRKYLKTNGFNYIVDVYLKQVTNKLALYK